MDDDKLKDIFSSFNPEMGSDDKFMSRLDRTLDAIDAVKAQSASLRASRRKAIYIAAFVGFVFGALLSMLMPLFSATLVNLNLMVAKGLPLVSPEFGADLAGWAIIGVATTFLVINSYRIALYMLRRKHSGVNI